MKHVLFMAAATVLIAAGSVIASDRHHGHHSSGHHSSGHHSSRHHSSRHHGSHFGLHSSGHHGGLHYGLHSSHRSSHYSGHHSGFSVGLLLGRSYGYNSYPSYRYSSPSYRYSSPSYRSYSTPLYQSRSYSNRSCVIQIAPQAPRRELQNPATRPPKKKVEPAPQPVLPLEPSPNVDSFDINTVARISVASTRTVQNGIRIQTTRTGKVTSEDLTLGTLGPQFAIPQTRSLVADDAVPFIVPMQQDRPSAKMAVQDAEPRLLSSPPLPVPYVVEEPVGTTSLPSVPQAMKGIALLPFADQKVALAQRTCPVTGDLLGADGKPMKVQLRGRTVFVCCKGCMDDLKANPQKYLANRP